MVRNDDMVTRILQRVLGYSHCRQIVYFDSNDKLLLEEEAYNGWKEFLNRVSGKIKDYSQLRLSNRQAHSLSAYIKALEGVREKK